MAIQYKRLTDEDQIELLWQRGQDTAPRGRKDRVKALKATEGQRRFPTIGCTMAMVDAY